MQISCSLQIDRFVWMVKQYLQSHNSLVKFRRKANQQLHRQNHFIALCFGSVFPAYQAFFKEQIQNRKRDVLQGARNRHAVNASKDNTQFLINPFGLMFYEVSASNLIKVDLEGNILERGSTEYECFRPGWLLQSAVHAARPDLQCLIHVHTPAGTAVSAMKCGLLKCSQDALLAGEIANHPYRGIFMDEEEMKSIVESLGRSAKVLILQNHGLLVGGDTIEDAFFRLTHVMAACEVQIRLMASGNLDNIILPEEMMLDKERQVILRDRKTSGRVMTKSGTAMPVKELQFEAQVRMLDIMGLKTGYKYKKMPKAFLEKKTQ
ncbi:alpha-adducin-like isoform X3 [Ptychodera flava]|uniref:alpha-adducin-like isoform X3 n=1 Tax=Ptychodera flava TaxID=63121 RepID=UPI00396A1592